jgi:hypothetical protein
LKRPVRGQPDAVGHQQAKQHLLARIEKALDAAEREALEQRVGIGDRPVAGERRQPLALLCSWARISASNRLPCS